jgi:drug/metabolite transporter (DMT)-like permease
MPLNKKISKRSKNTITYIFVSLIISGLFYYLKPRFFSKENPKEKIDEINILYFLFAGFGVTAICYYLLIKHPYFLNRLLTKL